MKTKHLYHRPPLPHNRPDFHQWLEMSSLRDILKDVPQDPTHHPEGPVFTHTRMVRYAMDRAIEILREAQAQPGSAFANLNLDLTQDEKNILRMAGWMHDIGKAGATTLKAGDEDIPWTEKPDPSTGRWRAISHETPEFYEPQLQKLQGSMWQPIWDKSSEKDKEDFFFVVQHHMGLRTQAATGFGKRLSNQWIDEKGQYKNERKIKLLLVLVLMDRLGRGVPDPEGTATQAIADMQAGAQEAQRRKSRPQTGLPAPDDPLQFLQALVDKPIEVKKVAFQGKFGRPMSDAELAIASQ